MRDVATPQDDDRDAQPPAAPTPQQRAASIRTAAAEVLARVQEWRGSGSWREDDNTRRRYQLTADAIAALNALPDPDDRDGIAAIVDTVRPILTEWRPPRPGPEQAIYAAVERLYRAARD